MLDQQTRKQLINQQAWEDVAPQVRDLFHARQRELLAEAGFGRRVNRGPRRIASERNDRFIAFVEAMLDGGHLDTAPDDTLELVETFLEKPTPGNRLRLLARLTALPGVPQADLGKFT